MSEKSPLADCCYFTVLENHHKKTIIMSSEHHRPQSTLIKAYLELCFYSELLNESCLWTHTICVCLSSLVVPSCLLFLFLWRSFLHHSCTHITICRKRTCWSMAWRQVLVFPCCKISSKLVNGIRNDISWYSHGNTENQVSMYPSPPGPV